MRQRRHMSPHRPTRLHRWQMITLRLNVDQHIDERQSPSQKKHQHHNAPSLAEGPNSETPVRKSGRPKAIRLPNIDIDDLEEEERKPRSKSKVNDKGGVSGRRRHFYGKITLTTKGLLSGDGVKVTAAAWPKKKPYTVRSKLVGLFGS